MVSSTHVPLYGLLDVAHHEWFVTCSLHGLLMCSTQQAVHIQWIYDWLSYVFITSITVYMYTEHKHKADFENKMCLVILSSCISPIHLTRYFMNLEAIPNCHQIAWIDVSARKVRWETTWRQSVWHEFNKQLVSADNDWILTQQTGPKISHAWSSVSVFTRVVHQVGSENRFL